MSLLAILRVTEIQRVAILPIVYYHTLLLWLLRNFPLCSSLRPPGHVHADRFKIRWPIAFPAADG